MRNIITSLALSVTPLLVVACGSEIGDPCTTSLDCSPDGDRLCERSESSPGGYCTVEDCDYDTCPDEAVCVRFFSAVFPDLVCDPATEDIETDDCLSDEICTLGGTCAPLLSEVRYCMRRCSSGGDCRGAYECRDEALMLEHGGEPILAPDAAPGARLPRFCAVAPDA